MQIIHRRAFPNIDPARHTTPPPSLPHRRPRTIVGIDPGGSSPTALVLIHRWCRTRIHVAEAAQFTYATIDTIDHWITARTQRDACTLAMDPAADQTAPLFGCSAASLLGDRGYRVALHRERRSTSLRVVYHWLQGTGGRPHLTFSPAAAPLMHALATYTTDLGLREGTRPTNPAAAHLVDALRYGLVQALLPATLADRPTSGVASG